MTNGYHWPLRVDRPINVPNEAGWTTTDRAHTLPALPAAFPRTYLRTWTLKLLPFFLCWTLAGYGQNLIQNPDGELPLVAGKIPGWVASVGTSWTYQSSDPLPQRGQNYFFAGAVADAELTQLIEVSDYSCSIDFGIQTFDFTGFVRSFAQSPADQSQIILDLLNGQGVTLSSYNSGQQESTTSWQQLSTVLTAPVGTRRIRIRLLSHRRNGSDNDGYFDNLSLVPTPSDKNISIARVTAVSATCGGADGSLEIQTAGGAGRIFYSRDGVNFQNSNVFTGLTGGVYNLTVKDQSNSGCTSSQRVTLVGGLGPQIQQITSVSAGCGQPTGSLTVTAGGSSSLQYSIDGARYQSSNQFNGLAGGVYSITVKDSARAGCSVTQSTTVASGNAPRIESITSTSASCGQANGALVITMRGGNGLVEYALDGTTFQTSNTFSGLAGGVYTVTVRDQPSLGCPTSQSATVGSAPGLRIETLDTSPATCGQATGSIRVQVAGGSGLVQYSLDGRAFQSANTYANLAQRVYLLTVKDAGNCTLIREVNIGSSCQLFAPDAFSPNNDGLNDYFRILPGGQVDYRVNQFLVYNRWGTIVFASRDFSMLETRSPWWDGLVDGQPAPEGVYAYVLDCTDAGQKKVVLKGQFILVR